MAGDGFRMPPRMCPHCGEVLDAAAPLDTDARPEPGDLSLCARCGGLVEFGSQLELLIPSDATIAELQQDRVEWSRLMQAQALLRDCLPPPKKPSRAH